MKLGFGKYSLYPATKGPLSQLPTKLLSHYTFLMGMTSKSPTLKKTRLKFTSQYSLGFTAFAFYYSTLKKKKQGVNELDIGST